MRMVRLSWLAAAVASLSIGGAAKPEAGWAHLARHERGEAEAIFAALPEGAERRLGLAAVWLGKRPRTDENTDEAERLLRVNLAEEATAWVRGMSWYLLGRIEQVFREGRTAEAEACYRRLLEEQPGSLPADLAAVKLAVLVLGECLERGGDLREVAAGLPRPERRELRAQFELVAAGHHIEAGERGAALARLLRVRELDTLKGRNRADVLVQIGRLAEAEGRVELAREAYGAFLETDGLDPRAHMVRDRRAGLGGGE